MAVFKIPAFSGKITKISPRLIPEDSAQVATNLRLESGRIEPLKSNLATGDTFPAQTQTIWRYSSNVWFQFTADVDVVRSPVPEDPHDRVYLTGSTYPRMTNNVGATAGPPYPGVLYRLGLPAPAKPVPTISGTGTEGETAQDIAYALTLVTAFGEESKPSAVTTADIVSWTPGQTRSVAIPAFPTGSYYTPGRKFYLYRTDSAGTFRFVAEILNASTTYVDSVTDAQLGETIPSQTWEAPPDEDTAYHPDGQLLGLTSLPNGILAGFTGNTVCFSEAYIPHAFPPEYQITVKSPVVALASIAPGLLVTTTEKPVLIQGSSPAGMSVQELDANYPCVSKRSMVDMGEYAIYASSMGLVLADSNGLTVATREIISRDQWQSYNPTTIHAYQHNGKYIGFYNGGGFIFDPRGEKNAWIDLNFSASAGFYDRSEDTLYLLVSGVMYKFDSGSALTYTWKSKEFYSPRAFCPLAAKVEATSYPLTFKLYADGVLKHTETVQNSLSFPLPAGYLANEFEVEVSGTAAINYIAVADNRQEL
jgi:hypothetical protein